MVAVMYLIDTEHLHAERVDQVREVLFEKYAERYRPTPSWWGEGQFLIENPNTRFHTMRKAPTPCAVRWATPTSTRWESDVMTTWVVEVGDPDQDDVTGGDIYGPFRSYEKAKEFEDKVLARLPENRLVNCGISRIQEPLLRNVRASEKAYFEDDV
jgi:hypothetical protein